MNTSKSLKDMHIQWTDLLRACEGADVVRNFVAGAVARTYPSIPAGIYNQSSISPIVDEYRGIKTMGHCYNRITYEAKRTGDIASGQG
jgi:hypothetical protein